MDLKKISIFPCVKNFTNYIYQSQTTFEMFERVVDTDLKLIIYHIIFSGWLICFPSIFIRLSGVYRLPVRANQYTEEQIGYHNGIFFASIATTLCDTVAPRIASFSGTFAFISRPILEIVTVRLYFRVTVGRTIWKMPYQESHLRHRTSISEFSPRLDSSPLCIPSSKRGTKISRKRP